MFGYEPRLIADDRSVYFAQPEKVLLDLLYLYPEYKSNQHMSDLRLNDDFLHEDMNKDLLDNYVTSFENNALEQRVQTLYNVYGL